ncbi:hypothetical protein [Flavobacterium sp. LB1P62]|uniref:hypothetical protein n=1 Tax=Flavobacterium sp. LB1P62 TaxID=3401715 RepID=UPI003AABD2A8
MVKKLLSNRKILILILSLSTYLSGSAQNFIYKGSQKYEATNSWKFKLNGDYWKGNPEFTVAKNNSGAYLMATITVPFKTHYIGGILTIFLENGKIIKCIDRKIRDHYDDASRTLYQLTKDEVELLKDSEISTIRFNILTGNSMQNESFTASNLITYDGMQEIYNKINKIEPKERYETDIEIKELFID